jgi:hypothetical protein
MHALVVGFPQLRLDNDTICSAEVSRGRVVIAIGFVKGCFCIKSWRIHGVHLTSPFVNSIAVGHPHNRSSDKTALAVACHHPAAVCQNICRNTGLYKLWRKPSRSVGVLPHLLYVREYHRPLEGSTSLFDNVNSLLKILACAF